MVRGEAYIKGILERLWKNVLEILGRDTPLGWRLKVWEGILSISKGSASRERSKQEKRKNKMWDIWEREADFAVVYQRF